MKQLLIILTVFLMLGVGSCKTKKIDVDIGKKSVEKVEKTTIDSVAVSQVQAFDVEAKTNQLRLSQFTLESMLDSTGRPRELEFVHEKNGKIIEKITVSGGKLHIRKSASDTAGNTIKITGNKAVTTVQSASDKTEKSTEKSFLKKKETRIKGFQTDFYIALIVIAVAVFIAWRSKLFRWF